MLENIKLGLKGKLAFLSALAFVSFANAQQTLAQAVGAAADDAKTEIEAIVGALAPVLFAILGILIAVGVGIALFRKGGRAN